MPSRPQPLVGRLAAAQPQFRSQPQPQPQSQPQRRLPAMAVAAAVAQPASPAPAPVPAALAAAPAPVAAPATPAGPRPVPIDMELPGAASTSHYDLYRQARRRGWRRNAARAAAVLLVLLITLSGLLVSQSYLKLHHVFRGDAGTAAALNANVKPGMLKGEGQGRVNILLLGRGGGSHEGPDLTDSMMVASIDPVNHQATLLSLPRDLWVNVPSAGDMKLNAVWETGEFQYLGKQAPGSTNPKAIEAGFKLVDQTVHQILGIDLDYNVLVNFQAFQQAVDTVDGVTVNVPSDLVDPTMAWENGGNPVLAKAGTDNFNGMQALLYVRSRETTSDFARAQRQRAVLVALKNKIETLGTLSNPFKISGLLNAFGNNVQTDLSLSNAERLYSIVKGINSSSISSIDLDGDETAGSTSYVTTGNMNGQSIVLPSAGLFQYGQIQQYVRGQLKDPYIMKEKARVVVLNGTTTPGLATNEANELKSYGYNVVQVGNAPVSNWTATTLVNLSHGKDPYTLHYLEQRLGIKAVSNLGSSNIPTNGADFVIIIGSDEVNASNTPQS